MKTALLSKAALCVCPPALLATTVATVPPVRKAVHALTRPHPVVHHHMPTRVASQPSAAVSMPCASQPPVTLRTFADPGPLDLSSVPARRDPLEPEGGGGPGGSPDYILSTAGSPLVLGVQPVGSVPEPATWLMLVIGLGAVGTALRFAPHQSYRVKTGAAGVMLTPAVQKRGTGPVAVASGSMLGVGALWSLLAAVRISSKPATATGQVAAVGGKAAGSAALAKLLMCLCPPAAMIAGTAAIPTVRQAVYRVTAPQPISTAPPVTNAALPCDPAVMPLTATTVIPLVPESVISSSSSSDAASGVTTASTRAHTIDVPALASRRLAFSTRA